MAFLNRCLFPGLCSLLLLEGCVVADPHEASSIEAVERATAVIATTAGTIGPMVTRLSRQPRPTLTAIVITPTLLPIGAVFLDVPTGADGENETGTPSPTRTPGETRTPTPTRTASETRTPTSTRMASLSVRTPYAICTPLPAYALDCLITPPALSATLKGNLPTAVSTPVPDRCYGAGIPSTLTLILRDYVYSLHWLLLPLMMPSLGLPLLLLPLYLP